MAKDLVRTRRYVQKFYQMRTQLQAVGLRIQTLRSNQQMADAMRGATRVRLIIIMTCGWNANEPVISGDGCDEPRTQSASNSTYYERV